MAGGTAQDSAQSKYAAQRWQADARLTRYAALVALILHPIGGLTDYAIIGSDSRLVPLLGARLAASLLHLPILMLCWRARAQPPRYIEALIAAAFAVSVLAGVLLPTALRPTSVASQGGPLLLLLVLYALVFPAWRRLKIGLMLLMSAIYVGIGGYWRSQIGYGGSHELITISIFLVAIGTLIPRVTRRIEQTEYERFMAQDELSGTVERLREEIELREQRELALDVARREAEDANAAKTSFMASVSHELRTPLVGILGAAELMRDSPQAQAGELRERVELLRLSGDLMLELVNDLLDYFKLEAGKLSLRALPLNLNHVTRATVELLDARARERGLELRCEIDEDLPEWIEGDPVRLQQLLLNLLGNAIKFTDEGHVELSLRRVQEGAGLDIEVRDTGVGMEPDFVERMFEPFEQAEHTRDRPQGSGLGLAITHHLITQMGGTIAVESALGEGTCVRVSLPLRGAEAPVVEERAGGPAEAAKLVEGLDVVIGEDNPVNAMILVAMLAAAGHRVTHAPNGSELLELASTGDYDVVLTDRRMPGLDGAEVARQLRALGAPRGTVPILALTAEAFEEEHAQLREAGIDEVLVKPIGAQQLAEAIARQVLKTRG